MTSMTATTTTTITTTTTHRRRRRRSKDESRTSVFEARHKEDRRRLMERSSEADEGQAGEGGRGGTHSGVEAEGRAINSQNGEGYSRGWPHISPLALPTSPATVRAAVAPASLSLSVLLSFAVPLSLSLSPRLVSLRRRRRRGSSPPRRLPPSRATVSLLISTGVRGIRRRSTEIRRSSQRERWCASGLVDARHVCLLGRSEHICRSSTRTYPSAYIRPRNTYVDTYIRTSIYIYMHVCSREYPRGIYIYIYIIYTARYLYTSHTFAPARGCTGFHVRRDAHTRAHGSDDVAWRYT